jgi:uncharacterized protein YlzI (FlbEa/FlbD family)
MQGNVLYKLDNGERELECEANVEVEDYVFLNSEGKAEKANSSSINTMPCIGRVIRVSNGKCYIKKDFVEDSYSDVVPRTVFFISNTESGQIMDEPPTGPQTVIQHIGIGMSNDRILVGIDPSNIVIRS